MGVRRNSTTVPASGVATVVINHNLSGIVWEVQQVTVSCGPASTSGNVGIFINNDPLAPAAVLAPIVDANGRRSIAQTFAGHPYIYIYASDQLQVVGSGLTTGDNYLVTWVYREILEADFEAGNYVGR